MACAYVPVHGVGGAKAQRRHFSRAHSCLLCRALIAAGSRRTSVYSRVSEAIKSMKRAPSPTSAERLSRPADRIRIWSQICSRNSRSAGFWLQPSVARVRISAHGCRSSSVVPVEQRMSGPGRHGTLPQPAVLKSRNRLSKLAPRLHFFDELPRPRIHMELRHGLRPREVWQPSIVIRRASRQIEQRIRDRPISWHAHAELVSQTQRELRSFVTPASAASKSASLAAASLAGNGSTSA